MSGINQVNYGFELAWEDVQIFEAGGKTQL
jgi:hypothetical protein